MLIKATQILVTSAKSLPQSSNPHFNFMPSLRKTGPGAYVYLSRPSTEVLGEVLLTQSTLTCQHSHFECCISSVLGQYKGCSYHTPAVISVGVHILILLF